MCVIAGAGAGAGANQIINNAGGNTGVGKETALQLALHGATVIIGCRSHSRGAEAVESLRQVLRSADKTNFPHATNGSVETMPLDLSCFFSVHAFASSFMEQYNHLDILINNGGLNLKSVNRNGLQELFMVNYLSHYLLFRLLEPALVSCSRSRSRSSTSTPSEARVVNLSSVMHHEGNSEFERSAFSKYSATDPHSYYSDSKLYLNYLTVSINSRLAGIPPSSSLPSSDKQIRRRVTAVSVNPGAVRSDIWRHVPWPVSVPYDLFMRLFFLSVQQGAAPSLFAATVTLPSPSFSFSSSSSSSPSSSHLLPYVTPYRVHFNLLAFEMMGPFGGARWASPSEPEGAEDKARELFQYSETLINALVEDEKDAQFAGKKFHLCS